METILIINSISLWILLLFNILLTIGLARRINRQFLQFDFLKPGQPIPDFTAWTLQEETVTSEDYVAQRVALIFISPTCQPCREVIPEVESWQTEAQAQDLLLVFVSDASVAETKQFVAELNVTRPCLVAPRNRTSFLADFKVNSTPSFYLINAGKVEMAGVGIFELGEKINMSSGNTKGGDV